MIVVIGEFRLPDANIDAAREAMEQVIIASRAEPGCLSYTYAQDVLDPGLFRVSECWNDKAALDFHFMQPHMKHWQQVRVQLGMTGRQVTAHAVSASEAL